MTPLHVELPCSREAESLALFLAEHGLAASLTSSDDYCEIQVQYPFDPEMRLRQDFERTLALWLATQDEPLVPAVTREHEYVLRPPGD